MYTGSYLYISVEFIIKVGPEDFIKKYYFFCA